jgi:4-diphosphocytidyl-2-C-methyl-D-erythritol kinase
LISFPNCKINLGLSVTGKRSDGYHNLETVFYPVQIYDALEIIESESAVDEPQSGNAVRFTSTGLVVPGDATHNLCLKAYYVLREDFAQLPPIAMHLHKAIPIGAGLGGGSSDAAFTLRLLNEKFELNLTTSQLIDYALRLGSDCPFFILNKPCIATSRGELMEPIPLDLSGKTLVLVNCGIHINTGWAFAKLNRQTDKPGEPSGNLKQIIQQPVETWKEVLTNDFELPVFLEYPLIKTIKEQLYHSGALYASMTGSGSTVFGIFPKDAQPLLEFPPEYMVRTVAFV